MLHIIEALLDRFASGKLSRREAAAALATLAAPQAAPGAAPLAPRNINHVTLSVRDLAKSRSFYQNLLDAPVIGESAFECDLGLGDSFIALMKMNKPTGVDHFCIGVAGYDAGRVSEAISARGVKPSKLESYSGVKFREGQVYVEDPDGVRVQFARPDYAGEMKK